MVLTLTFNGHSGGGGGAEVGNGSGGLMVRQGQIIRVSSENTAPVPFGSRGFLPRLSGVHCSLTVFLGCTKSAHQAHSTHSDRPAHQT